MPRSRSLALAALAVLLPVGGRALAAPEAPGAPAGLRLSATISLGEVKGRIDHMAIDAAGKRLYVAALDDSSLQEIDLAAGKVSFWAIGLSEPQGIAIEPKTGRIVVGCGGDGKALFFDPADIEKPVAEVALGTDADNVRIDADGRVWVGYGNGALAAIENAGTSYKVAKRVPLAGHPESFQMESKGKRLFVNVPKAQRVQIVDRVAGTVTGEWKFDGEMDPQDPYPMALDEAKKRLWIGFRKPSRLVVLDTDSGKRVASVEVSEDVDDIWIDDKQGVGYLSCGEGFVDVVKRTDPDRYERVGRVETAVKARTSLFVPATGRLYVAVPRRSGQSPAILVYDTR